MLSLLFVTCKKANKKAAEMIPGHTWEITSITHNGVEVLDQYFEDSCLCKKLYFSKEPETGFEKEYAVYFMNCSNTSNNGYYSSIGNYRFYESVDLKPRKYAYLSFDNFNNTDLNCSCGRYGTANSFTITNIDTKNDTWTMSSDLPDGLWVVKYKKA